MPPSYTTGTVAEPSQGGHEPSGSAGTTPADGITGMAGAAAPGGTAGANPGGAIAGAPITGTAGMAPGGAGNAIGWPAICGCGYTGGASGGA